MQTKARAARLRAVEDKLRPPKSGRGRVIIRAKWVTPGEPDKPKEPGTIVVRPIWNDKGAGGHVD